MSVWNPENVKDVAESIGVTSLSDDVVQGLTSDIEFRISQVIEEALKFMRHGKRSVLSTQDITQSLRALGVEPLYGYESTRPLRFGEASIGPGQPLFYVEDEEVDFEKLINAPLPKIPRDISFTAHWLAVEGVQPSIPQNPTAAESRNQELVPRGSNANPNLAAMSGSDNVSVKPLVKHVLSQELQIFFEKVCSALLDESNNDYRVAALASVASDPGLHQLVPYFVQFIAEKVTHNLKNLFVLEQAMQLTHAMLDNKSLYIDPYVSPPIFSSPSFPFLPQTDALVLSDRLPRPSNTHLPDRPPPWYTDLHLLPHHQYKQPHQLNHTKLNLVLNASRTPTLRSAPPFRLPLSNNKQTLLLHLLSTQTATGTHLPESVPRPDQTPRHQLRRRGRSNSHRWRRSRAGADCPEHEKLRRHGVERHPRLRHRDL